MVKLLPFDPTVDDADVAWPPRGDVDEPTMRIVNAVMGTTMTVGYKLLTLIDACRYVSANDVEGDIVECGVWKGGSMAAAALCLLDLDDTTRGLWLYDTFSGMTAPTDEDSRLADGVSAEKLLASESKTSHAWATASLQQVRELMRSTGYPMDKIKFVEGDVAQTLQANLPNRISILRLDTDWYESTKIELDRLYDLVTPGGVVIIDDYGCWGGARQAVDDFFSNREHSPLMVRIADGRVLVKP